VRDEEWEQPMSELRELPAVVELMAFGLKWKPFEDISS
jgi:hypothetical protein